MSLWQRTMIGLARSQLMRKLMQGNPLTHSLATRFVGGSDAVSATAKAQELNKLGIRSSLYYLGEYVDSMELIEQNVAHIVTVAKQLGEAGLDLHVSVDPTQVGYAISDEIGERNILRIGRVIAEQPSAGKKVLMLDMEDFSYVEKTLALRSRLVREGIPTAITIQAYLYRSEQDLRQLIQEGAAVRLVKGAFAESKERAWTYKRDIDANYLRLAQLLLSPEARAKCVYPVFGTHDDRMINAIRPLLHENGWGKDSYEFEMLYGVRPSLQRQLVDEGHNVRVYLPFGTEWWPYTIRRIGENPANVRLVLHAIRND
ncbi:MAG: proline dehydrogenase family protein [Bacillota bacterium]